MPYKILMIDDSKLFKQLVKRILDKRCEECELILYDPVKEGRPGVDFNWGQYDLLLLDYHLGDEEVTGIDWLKSFRQAPHFPPAILVTGEGSEKVAVQAMKAGADEYLPKEGMDPDVLVDMIRNSVRNQEIGVQGNQDKRAFLSDLNESMQTAVAEPVALFFAEIDQAAEIRENKGLVLLESVIKEVEAIVYHLANRMFPSCEWIRWSDSVIAFTVSGNVTDDGSMKLAKAIGEQITQNRLEMTGGVDIPCTCSIGIAIIDEANTAIKSVLKRAEAASRAARIRGGNTAHIFPRQTAEDDNLSQTSVYRVQIKEKSAYIAHDKSSGKQDDRPPVDVPRAVKGDRFTMKFFPYLPMADGTEKTSEHFFEMLPEYRDHAGKTVTYMDLPDFLRNNEDVAEYDFYICRMAMKLGAKFEKENSAITGLFITPVSESIQRRKVFIRLHELVKKFEGKMVGKSMIFRIPVEDYIEQPQHVAKYFFELKKLGGVRFCITGIDRLEAFRCIQSFKLFDFAELSGAAEAEMNGTMEAEGKLQPILDEMKASGCKLVATGIDTPEQLMNVLVHGPDIAQGVLISPVTDDMDVESNAMTEIQL